jgi:hypothetical protein
MKKFAIIISFVIILFFSATYVSNAQTHGVDPDKLKMMMDAWSVEVADQAEVLPNEFIGSFKLTVKDIDQKGQVSKSSVIDIHSDKFPVCFELTTQGKTQNKMRLIMDPFKRTLTTLIDDKGKRIGMISPMPRLNMAPVDQRAAQPEEKSAMKIEATNEYKELEGFQCRKYIITDENAVTESWITTGETVSLESIFSMFSVLQKQDGRTGISSKQGEIKGMALESTTTLNSGEKVQMTITDIIKGKVDEAKFSTSGYQLTDLSKGFGR